MHQSRRRIALRAHALTHRPRPLRVAVAGESGVCPSPQASMPCHKCHALSVGRAIRALVGALLLLAGGRTLNGAVRALRLWYGQAGSAFHRPRHVLVGARFSSAGCWPCTPKPLWFACTRPYTVHTHTCADELRATSCCARKRSSSFAPHQRPPCAAHLGRALVCSCGRGPGPGSPARLVACHPFALRFARVHHLRGDEPAGLLCPCSALQHADLVAAQYHTWPQSVRSELAGALLSSVGSGLVRCRFGIL